MARGTSKSILERKAPPTFDVAIEIHDPKTWIIHDNIQDSVDRILQGQSFPTQKRAILPEYNNFIDCKILYNKKETDGIQENFSKQTNNDKKTKNNYLLNRSNNSGATKTKKLIKRNNANLQNELDQEFTFIYIYGINNQDLKSLIKTLRLPIIITKELQYADAVLALANLVKNNRKLKQMSHSKKITIHTIQSNSLLQIAKALRLLAKKNSMVPLIPEKNKTAIETILSKEFVTPLEETRLAIEEIVLEKNIVVDLFPRPNAIRKQQHELITHYHLTGVTVGEDKNRRLRIFPNNIQPSLN